jgi:hypothetical protein
LVAHEDGFRCPCCDYAQDWAHDFMTQQERMDAAKEAFVNAIHNRAK